MASVARTGRLLCVGEAWPWGGVTAEVIARVTSGGHGLLDAPPQRLNAKDTPVPYHPNLWTRTPDHAQHCGGGEKSFEALKKLCRKFPSSCRNWASPSPRPRIVNFLVKAGDTVEADQDLIEVETNKATMAVTSPCSGRLEKLTAQLNESYPVGAMLGQIEITQEEAARLGLDIPAPVKTSETDRLSKSDANGGKNRVQPTVRGLPVPANAAGASLSRRGSRRECANSAWSAADLAGIPGSGAAGRVTVEDFEKFIAHLEKQRMSQASTMRVAVADAMRRSWTRPLAHVGLPVCLDPLFAYRKVARPKPGPALCALRALAVALAENSAPAGRLGRHQNRASFFNRHRLRRRSRGRRVCAGDSRCGQTDAEGFDCALQRTG